MSAVQAYVEHSFLRELEKLDSRDQEHCLLGIHWFEAECDDEGRTRSSNPVEDAVKRRLRCIRAGGDLRVVYAITAGGTRRNWIWVGTRDSYEAARRRLDAAPAEKVETIDVAAMLLELRTEGSVRPFTPIIPAAKAVTKVVAQVDLGRLVETAGDVSRSVAGAMTALEELRALVAARALPAPVPPVTPSHAPVPVAVITDEIVAETSLFKGLLADFNAAGVERDRLAEELRRTKKKLELEEFEKVRTLGKMHDEELGIVKRENERLRTELAAAKTALKERATNAFSDEIKQQIKTECAKVCFEQAKKLDALGRPSLHEQAEELRKLSRVIESLKV